MAVLKALALGIAGGGIHYLLTGNLAPAAGTAVGVLVVFLFIVPRMKNAKRS